MKWPTIQDDSCPTQEQAWCPNNDNGSTDPTGGMRLVIKPEQATVCAPGFMQFEAFLETPAGETKLVEGLTWQSSSSSLLIDSANGGASILASGIVTVSVTWTNLSAAAQVDIAGDGGDCCENVKVSTVVLEDVSQSMGQLFASSYGTKGKLALALARAHIAVLNPKDELLLSTFSEGGSIIQDFDSDSATILAAMTYPTAGTRLTDIKGAIEWGLVELRARTTDRTVLVLLTDGVSVAALTNTERDELVAEVDGFRSGGGILIVAGIRAYGTGYALLQRIASPGFFLNVNSTAQLDSALAVMASLPAYYCAGLCVTSPDDGYTYAGGGYGGYCSTRPPDAQAPDPNPLPNIEEGETGGGGDNGLTAQLDDLNWKIPCGDHRLDGTCFCQDPPDVSTVAQGESGRTYSVVLRVRGLVECKPYLLYGASGSQSGKVFTPTNPHQSIPIFESETTYRTNEYALVVSNPPLTLMLNNGATTPTGSEVVDYQITVPIKTGATVSLKARAIDRLQWANDSNLSVGGSPPPLVVAEAYDGQYLQINVVSIT